MYRKENRLCIGVCHFFVHGRWEQKSSGMHGCMRWDCGHSVVAYLRRCAPARAFVPMLGFRALAMPHTALGNACAFSPMHGLSVLARRQIAFGKCMWVRLNVLRRWTREAPEGSGHARVKGVSRLQKANDLLVLCSGVFSLLCSLSGI